MSNEPTHGKGSRNRSDFAKFQQSSYWEKKVKTERLTMKEFSELKEKVRKIHTK